jgi:hypothetical protein
VLSEDFVKLESKDIAALSSAKALIALYHARSMVTTLQITTNLLGQSYNDDLTLCRRLSLPRDNRRQCFFTPFDGALCWSLACLGRCPTVLKGLTLCRRSAPPPWGHLEANDFSCHFDEFCVYHRPQRVKGRDGHGERLPRERHLYHQQKTNCRHFVLVALTNWKRL